MSEVPVRAFRGGKILLGGFLLLLLLLLLGRWGAAVYVDLLWFSAQGRTDVYLTRMLWDWGTRFLVAGATAALVWTNLKVVARTFPGLQIRRRVGDLVIQEQLPESYIRWGILLAGLFVGLWFALAVPQGTGLRGLLLVHSEPWGQADPVFGRDLGFYVFVLPILRGLLAYGLVVTVFLVALTAAGYTATGAINWGEGRVRISHLPRLHLGILAAAFLLILAFRFYVAPYGLVLDGNSAVQGIFGYTDHHSRIPAYRMVAFLSLAAAGAAFWGAVRGRLLPLAAGGVALAVGTLALAEVYPAVVQRFQVQPNELTLETPYIQDAVEFTRYGFGLQGFERADLDYDLPDGNSWDEALERLSRLPVWTEHTFLTNLRQLQARFQYYDFHEIAFDRYGAGGGIEPVAVSAREVDRAGIPDPNWQNLHLRERYIAGEGVVAGPLNRSTGGGRMPFFLTTNPPVYRSASPDVPAGLELTRPHLFVGSRPQLHAVINPSPEEFLAPDGAMGEPGVDFPRGIPMGSLFRTAALAWRFQDANLLLASEVTRESRLVFRRQVQERIRAVAPFLLLPEAPYPVVSDGRVFWIVEGFTLSRSLPLSQAHPLPGQRTANYIRNAVKVTVDAVTGETRFYVTDPDDPLIRAYRSGFPSLFHDLDEAPEPLLRHFRYPRFLLRTQVRVLARFHQDVPAVFHGQQDRWDMATQLSLGSQAVEYQPEYAILSLPGEDEESYVLSTVFVPRGRQNLAAFLAARWRPEEGAVLRLWDIPSAEQVPGPRQIEAMIEQDPEISQQFSLWRQAGSEVWTGHLHLVPVGNTLLYMEPVFLAADIDAIPEIRRYVVSDGRRVVMDVSLEGAVEGLAAGLEGVIREGRPDVVEVPAEVEAPLPAEPAPAPDPVDPPVAAPGPGEALQLLEEAEARLRAGDWEGFGQKLGELRELLRRQAEGVGGG